MDILSKLAVKYLAVETAAYGIIVIAFLGISQLVGKTWAIETLFSTAGLAILLIIYSALAHTAYIPLLRRGGKSVLGFYLLAKTFRLLLAILLLLVYVFARGHDILFLLWHQRSAEVFSTLRCQCLLPPCRLACRE